MENACQIQDKKLDFLKIFKNLDCLKIRQEKEREKKAWNKGRIKSLKEKKKKIKEGSSKGYIINLMNSGGIFIFPNLWNEKTKKSNAKTKSKKTKET